MESCCLVNILSLSPPWVFLWGIKSWLCWSWNFTEHLDVAEDCWMPVSSMPPSFLPLTFSDRYTTFLDLPSLKSFHRKLGRYFTISSLGRKGKWATFRKGKQHILRPKHSIEQWLKAPLREGYPGPMFKQHFFSLGTAGSVKSHLYFSLLGYCPLLTYLTNFPLILQDSSKAFSWN